MFQLLFNFHIISIILKSFEQMSQEFLIKLVIKQLHLISPKMFFDENLNCY